MKQCKKCGQTKADSDFRPDRYKCRRCCSLERHPERVERKPRIEGNTFTGGSYSPVFISAERFPNLAAFDAQESTLPAPTVVTSSAQAVPVVTELSPVEEHRLKVKNAELARQVKTLTAELSNAQILGDFAREAAEAAASVEPITFRERTSGLREGTVQVLVSDLHIEEEVKPEQVAGRNRYNLEISKQRCERLFQGTLDGIRMYRQTYKIRDLILWLGGDLLTSYLHPDNVETALLSPVEAIAELFTRITGGIDLLLRDPELERIVVPCNDGNHGRLTEKMRSAARIQNSIEWLLYKMLADHYKSRGETRVQFILPTGSHTYYEVYGSTIHYTHGDEAKYGGGIGGILVPIRKAVDRWGSVRAARLNCLGHFHQRVNTEDIIVNGSMIGYSSYSFTIGARFEPPVQDFSILDSKRWRGPSMPIWVADREDDNGY